jgi:hypothetical protein
LLERAKERRASLEEEHAAAIERAEDTTETLHAWTSIAEFKAAVVEHLNEAFRLVGEINLLAPSRVSLTAARYVRDINTGVDTSELHDDFLIAAREDIGVDPPEVYS